MRSFYPPSPIAYRRMLFIFLISLQQTGIILAQQSGIQPAALNNPILYSPGRLLDTALDYSGNKYTLGQISTDDAVRARAGAAPQFTGESLMGVPRKGGGSHPSAGTKLASCTPGYFRLYLETGCGMDNPADPDEVARLAVMCQVLTDISNFIPSPCTASGQKINIWVRTAPGGGGFLGESTPFFSVPYSPTVSGIADNMIWITLNSGKDAWSSLVTPLYSSGTYSSFFHASVAFQFDGTVKWHTDMTTPPAPYEYDLYTVALHEMLHSLGFHTLINYDATSVFGAGFKYYSRFDQRLQTSSSLSLITNPGACSMYNYSFNAALTPSVTLSPGSTSSTCPAGYQTGPYVNHTVCTNAVRYVSPALNVPVYTPSCFEKGSSLSHFEDECSAQAGFPLTPPASNDHYYVMSNAGVKGPYKPATIPGAMKRYPQQEERQALCDMGYPVTAVYGTSTYLNFKSYTGGDCPGLQVAGINDGLAGGTYTYFSTGIAPIIISESSLLANDHGAAHAICMEVVNGTGTVTATTGSFTYAPGAGEYGVVLLRYLPVNAAGDAGNITYVYVFVGSANCTPTACDMVQNGGFEDADAGCGDMNMHPGIVHCWDIYCGSSDVFVRGCTDLMSNWIIPSTWSSPSPTDTHLMSKPPNDHFIEFSACNHCSGSDTDWTEGMQTCLSSPLVKGQKYVLSFWAKVCRNGSVKPLTNNHIMFATSPTTSPLAYIGYYVHAMPPGLDLLWDFVMPTGYGDDWHYYEKHFTFTGDAGSRLVIFNAPFMIYLPYSYILSNFIDDVSIKPEGTVCSFIPPSICSTSTTPIDLTKTVSIPGGTFGWPTTPVTGGLPSISHSPIFDPVEAVKAAIIDSAHGRITLSYTYTDELGCVQTVYANMSILTASVPPITGVMTTGTGLVTALSDSATGGIWTSSNTAVATVGSASGNVTGVSVGTATITYLIGTDCMATTTVTITLGPPPPPPYIDHDAVKPINKNTTQLNVFPNPNKGSFTLSGVLQNSGSSKEVQIELVDLLGKVRLKTEAAIEKGSISKSIVLDNEVANGTYFIKVKNGHTSEVVRFNLLR